MFNINNENWNVLIVEAYNPILMRPNGLFTLGCCDDETKTIYISKVVSGDLFWKVLCHEIAHAAMFSYDVTLTDEQEELIADIIATFGAEIIDITNMLFYKIQGGRYK